MAEEGRGTDRYRLAAVRDARAREERVKRVDVAVAVDDARQARARLETLRDGSQAARVALTAAVAHRDRLLRDRCTSAQLIVAERFVTRRRHELADAVAAELRAQAAHDAHQATIDVAQLELARARADREVIERHFERWRLSRKQLAERRAD